MKAFLMGMVAMVVITVIAALGLNTVNMSADQVYTSKTGDVRL
jgi:hypothetical protein